MSRQYSRTSSCFGFLNEPCTQLSKTDSNPFIFYSSLCGLRGAGAYPTSEGEGGVHPGKAASLLQGQHRVTNKHPHSHTHTYWQFRAANQPKTHVLGTVGGRRKTWRETTVAHQKRALFGIKYAKKNKSKCFALTGRFKTGSDITHSMLFSCFSFPGMFELANFLLCSHH